MPALFPDFEYDIFISYRKEDINLYFDENTYDGLLETHEVHDSLKGKLKCLIFIPVISRTYCDARSFAWEHEFRSFIELASADRFGLRVNLPNGNVASRVLPVRIHDLETGDVRLLEKQLGSVLRGIEFIYKEPGVNKPLTPEDDENRNLNRTKYAIQINRLANAIHEIIYGLRTESLSAENETGQHREIPDYAGNDVSARHNRKPAKQKTRKYLLWSLIVLVPAAVFFIYYPQMERKYTLKRLRSEDGRISVAVMPFQNLTNDTIWNIWEDGIQDNLISSLSNSEVLKVRRTLSVSGILRGRGLTNYASITPSIASNLSRRLDANVVICGSIKQDDAVIRLNAQLMDSRKEEVIRSFQIDGKEGNILPIIDSLSHMVRDFLIVSKMEKESSVEFKKYASTYSPLAYSYFMQGQKAFLNSDWPAAVKMYSASLNTDSSFLYPAIMLPFALRNNGMDASAKKACLEIYGKRDQMTIQQRLWINYTYAVFFETTFEAIKCIRQLLTIDDQVPILYNGLVINYLKLNDWDQAISTGEKLLEIYNKWDIKTESVWTYTNLGIAYHESGKYKEERALYRKAEEQFPDDWLLTQRQAILSLSEGDTVHANQLTVKYAKLCEERSQPESAILTGIASIYYAAHSFDKADKYYRKALSLKPENPVLLNNLAYFLIDSERNINEGLHLVDKALDLSPDNYLLLYSKGLGLHKLGRNREALSFLQRSDSLKPYYNHELQIKLDEVKKSLDSPE